MKTISIFLLLLGISNGGVLLQDKIVNLIKTVLTNTSPISPSLHVHRDKRSTWDQETNIHILGLNHKIKYVDTQDWQKGFKQEIFIKDASKIIPALPVKSIKLAVNVADGPKHNDGLDDVYNITADYVLEWLGGKKQAGSLKIYRNFEDSFYNFNVDFGLGKEFMNEDTTCGDDIQCAIAAASNEKNDHTVKLQFGSDYKGQAKLKVSYNRFEYILSYEYDAQTKAFVYKLDGEDMFGQIGGKYPDDGGRIELAGNILGEELVGYIQRGNDKGEEDSATVFYLRPVGTFMVPIEYVKFSMLANASYTTINIDLTYLGGKAKDLGRLTISKQFDMIKFHAQNIHKSKPKSELIVRLGFLFDMRSFIKYYFFYDDFVNAAKDYSLTLKEEIIEELVDYTTTIEGEFKDDKTKAFKIEYSKADERVDYSFTNDGSEVCGFADLDSNEDEMLARLHFCFKNIKVKYDFELKSNWDYSNVVFKFFINKNDFFSSKLSLDVENDDNFKYNVRWSGSSYGDGKVKAVWNDKDQQFKLQLLPKFGTAYHAVKTKDNLGNINFEIISYDDNQNKNQEAIITYNSKNKLYIRISKNFVQMLSEYVRIFTHAPLVMNNEDLEYNAEWKKSEVKITSNGNSLLKIKNEGDYLSKVQWKGEDLGEIGMAVCKVGDNTTEAKFTTVDLNDDREDVEIRWNNSGDYLNNNLIVRHKKNEKDQLAVKLTWDARGLCMVKNGDSSCTDECMLGAYLQSSDDWIGLQYNCINGFQTI